MTIPALQQKTLTAQTRTKSGENAVPEWFDLKNARCYEIRQTKSMFSRTVIGYLDENGDRLSIIQNPGLLNNKKGKEEFLIKAGKYDADWNLVELKKIKLNNKIKEQVIPLLQSTLKTLPDDKPERKILKAFLEDLIKAPVN